MQAKKNNIYNTLCFASGFLLLKIMLKSLYVVAKYQKLILCCFGCLLPVKHWYDI